MSIRNLLAAAGFDSSVKGQIQYITTGTHNWVCPAGVTSVSVVCVGRGGTGYDVVGDGTTVPGGGGGALAYVNNIAVTAGNSYQVVIPAANNSLGFVNDPTTFNGTTVRAGGGQNAQGSRAGGAGGSVLNGTGGAGGAGGVADALGFGLSSGGGGAGGYAGAGGLGGRYGAGGAGTTGGAGSGGAGGGGGGGNAGGGGGVGLLGQGASGAGGTSNNRGGNGSGGVDGGSLTSGGNYGGGGAFNTQPGGGGACRIIWPGSTRQFPSTNTGDM